MQKKAFPPLMWCKCALKALKRILEHCEIHCSRVCVFRHLQRSAQLHRVALLHHSDAEVWRLQKLFEDLAVGLISGSWNTHRIVNTLKHTRSSALRDSHAPMVVSQNFSSATSLAMLAPISTLTSISSLDLMMSEIRVRPSGPSSMP